MLNTEDPREFGGWRETCGVCGEMKTERHECSMFPRVGRVEFGPAPRGNMLQPFTDALGLGVNPMPQQFIVTLTEQQMKCLRGEHEGDEGIVVFSTAMMVKICKHCRCLYVERET